MLRKVQHLAPTGLAHLSRRSAGDSAGGLLLLLTAAAPSSAAATAVDSGGRAATAAAANPAGTNENTTCRLQQAGTLSRCCSSFSAACSASGIAAQVPVCLPHKPATCLEQGVCPRHMWGACSCCHLMERQS